jgi:acyl-CoA thioesterase I
MSTQLLRTRQKLTGGDPLTMVFLGDSLTSGWMVNRGYLDFLRGMLAANYPAARITIINRGVPGDTARGGLQRLQRDVLAHEPDLVGVQFALNDAFTGCSPESYERTVSAIVARIRQECAAEVLLITSVLPGDIGASLEADVFYRRLKDIASRESAAIALVDDYWRERIAGGIDHTGLLQPDGVHPTEAGYRLMAEAVLRMLV